MKKYYSIEFSANSDNAYFELFNSNVEKLYRKLNLGKSLKDEKPMVKIDSHKNGGELTDLLWFVPFLVVSFDLKEILQKRSSDLEFFKVEIESNNSDKSFFILNVLNNIQGLDLEESDVEFYEDSSVIKSANKIMFLSNINRDIFRLHELKSKLFVSDLVKNDVLEQNLTGIKFLELEEIQY